MINTGNSVLRRLAGTIALLASLLSVPAAQAASPDMLSRVADFVLETSREAVAVSNTDAGGREKLQSLFMARFDYELMGRYAMGLYWPKASPAQQSEYRALFAAYVPAGYADQLTAYHDADISVIRSQTVQDGDTMITTRVMPKTGDETDIHWRVRTSPTGYKVIDIVVDGVSYLTMLREQFTAFAARNGIDGLLDLLRKQTTAEAAGDIDGTAAKMRATSAINVPSRLALKHRIDSLVDDLGACHGSEGQFEIAGLKSRFDVLVERVISLLQPGDPPLAAEIEFMHAPVLEKLSGPRQFAIVAMR